VLAEPSAGCNQHVQCSVGALSYNLLQHHHDFILILLQLVKLGVKEFAVTKLTLVITGLINIMVL
jgi:hypothetical protein